MADGDEISAVHSTALAGVPPQITLLLQRLVAEAVAPLAERIEALEEENRALEADLEEFNDLRALEIAQNRRRISTLEEPNVPPPTAKTLDHLDHLAKEMKESRTRQLSVTRAAKILGLSPKRVHQLRPLIEHDKRFNIVDDPHHKQRLMIRMW